MKPLRILILAEGDPETRDSWSESSRSLLLALRQLGHTVIGRDVTESRPARWAGMLLTWAPSRPRWAARFHLGPIGFSARSRRARAQIAALTPSPDVVLAIGATFDGLDDRIPSFLYCDANVRVSAQGGGYSDVDRLTAAEVVRLAGRERGVYQRARMVFTMSDFLRRSFLDDFRLPADRVRTVYAGANLDVSKVEPRPHLQAGPPTILYVGRQWERKGGPTLVEAFRGVRQALPDARLRIVGCDPPIGGEPGIEVIGPIRKDAPGGENRLAELFRTSDLFCMTSRFEPFGIVFVEAMLHGLACIASDRFAMPEIVAEGKTGWLVPADNPGQLRDRLIAALGDRQALFAMGQAGRERALALFTWDRVAQNMATAMASALG